MIALDLVVAVLVRMANYHHIDEDHSGRTAEITMEIAKRLGGLSDDQLRLLNLAALIHDIGRVGVDNALVSKRGWLTASQMAAVKEHSQIGFDFINGILPDEISLAVLHHHEHYDGSGYPHKLQGEDIPLFSRIISIADVWDALTNLRPYRPAMSKGDALTEMNKMAQWFDPQLYAMFLELLRKHG